MKLAAQRVMQPARRGLAIHAFHYSHGPYIWEGAPPPDLGNGTLQVSRTVLRPLGGNSVLTYLDVIAPDEVSNARILLAFAQIYEGDQAPPFKQTVGNCTFESNMIHSYLLGWRQELVGLFEAALSVRASLPESAG